MVFPAEDFPLKTWLIEQVTKVWGTGMLPRPMAVDDLYRIAVTWPAKINSASFTKCRSITGYKVEA